MPRITLVIIWVWTCAGLNCAGWGLSALDQLNPAGYAVFAALGLAGYAWWRRNAATPVFRPADWRKCRRRFRCGFPLAFLLLGGLAFLGGLLHAPTNYDGLSYRIPRVLHWLDSGHWLWIHTVFSRVNDRSCGIEWVSAPLISWLQTDRWLFVINVISFFLLPGLIFSVFTRLGVRPRVARHWMWLIPTGYCYLQQAGSIGNDLFCATIVLAAMDFALRARTAPTPANCFTAIIAAAMMTSAKTTSLPLLLPWFIAFFPTIRWLPRWPLRCAIVCLLAIFTSVLPTLVMNARHARSTGWSAGGLVFKSTRPAPPGEPPAIKLIANTGSLLLNNFVPPLFPLADAWNHTMDRKLPVEWHHLTDEAEIAEIGLANLHVDQMQIEENSGLGFGLAVLLAVTWLAAGRAGQPPGATLRLRLWQRTILWSAWISLAAILSQSPLSAISRLITPYYALLLPWFLIRPGIQSVIRRFWWRLSAGMILLIAAGLVCISPARPLLPMQAFLEKIQAGSGHREALDHPLAIYSTYAQRNDALAPLRTALAALPDASGSPTGLVAFDRPETSLWRPFGSCRVIHVRPEDTAEQLRAAGIKYIVVAPGEAGNWFELAIPLTFEEWMKNIRASVAEKIPLTTKAATGPEDWWVLKLD